MFIIRTNFYKHSREHSQFLFQRGDFSTTQGVDLVCRRLELLEEEECSPCFALSQSESGFQPLNPSQNR